MAVQKYVNLKFVESDIYIIYPETQQLQELLFKRLVFILPIVNRMIQESQGKSSYWYHGIRCIFFINQKLPEFNSWSLKNEMSPDGTCLLPSWKHCCWLMQTISKIPGLALENLILHITPSFHILVSLLQRYKTYPKIKMSSVCLKICFRPFRPLQFSPFSHFCFYLFSFLLLFCFSSQTCLGSSLSYCFFLSLSPHQNLN